MGVSPTNLTFNETGSRFRRASKVIDLAIQLRWIPQDVRWIVAVDHCRCTVC